MCGLVYERNPGDTWAFTIVGDRLPIAAIIALIYFGYGRTHHVLALITFALLGIIVVVTAPNRWGVGIALHYLSRVYWPDPQDPVPQITDRHEDSKGTKTHHDGGNQPPRHRDTRAR